MGHVNVCDKQYEEEEEGNTDTNLHLRWCLSTNSTNSSNFHLCADFPDVLIIYRSCCVVFATFYIQLHHIKMYT